MSGVGNLIPATKTHRIYLIATVAIGIAGVGVWVWKNHLNTPQKTQTIISDKTEAGENNLFYSKPSYSDNTFLLADPNAPKDEDDSVTVETPPASQPSSTEPQVVIKYIQVPAPKPATFNSDLGANDFAHTVAPVQKTRSQLLEERRQKLLNARRKVNGGWSRTIDIDAIEQEDLDRKPPSAKDYSEHKEGKDVSTYPVDLTRTITADRYLECILREQINSQKEGRVTCQILNDIYGAHGRKVLIPAGSTAIGTHGTLKKVGDERFNITWKRIIRAGDGVHIRLTEAHSSDRSGQTGIGGIVDKRNWDKYGGAILTSTISALAQISIPVKSGSITNSVIQSYGTDLGQVTAAMINEGLNIKPYAIVPAGEIIKITPTTDIWLKHFNEHGAYFAPVEE